MSQNEITVKLKVNDDGSLGIVTTQAKKAKTAIDGVTTSTDNLNKSKNVHNRLEKGAAGITSNSTKAFAKQAQTIGGGGGLVAAYATLAANIFAITAAFGALKNAAALEQLETGLIRVGNAAGANLPVVADGLREITGAAISTQEAMQAVALGTSAGFSTDQLQGLTKVAKGASLALGRDMGDAMSRLTRGAAKLEPEILDELGIMVRLDDATSAYATTIGKTSSQLTQFERRMAFTNAIITQGEKKFGAIADSIDASPFDKLSATFSDLTKDILKVINVAFKPLAAFFAGNKGALLGGMVLFATTISRQMIPALAESAKVASAAADDFSELSNQQLSSLQATSKGAKVYNELLPKLKDGTATAKDQARALDSLTKSEKRHRIELGNSITVSQLSADQLAQKRVQYSRILQAKKAIVAATKAETLANSALLKSTALQNIQNGKIVEGLRFLKLAIYEQASAHVAESVAMTGKVTVLTALKVAYTSAGTAAKFFGTAMLAAIPIIGTIISLGAILLPMLGSLFEKSKVIQAAEKAAEGFESFNRIAEQLGETLRSTNDENDKYIATLRVNVGVMDQVISGLDSIKKAQQSVEAEKLAEAYKKLSKARANLNRLEQYDYNYPEYLEKVRKAEDNITKVISEQGQMSKEAAGIAIKAALAQAKASGVLTDKLKNSLEDIGGLVEVGIIKSWAALNRALKLSVRDSRVLLGNLDGISSVASSASKNLITLTNKGNGIYSGLITNLSEFKSASDSALKIGGTKALEVYEAKVKETNKSLYDLITNIGGGSFTKGLTSAIASMKKYSELVKTTKNTVAIHNAEMNKLKSSMKVVASSAEKYYEESNAAIQAQIDLAKSDLENKDKLNISATEQLALKIKIKNLEGQLVSESYIAIKAEQAKVALAKMNLSLQSKLIAGLEKQASAEESMARSRLKLSILKDRTRSDKSISASEEFNLVKEAADKQKELQKDSLDLKIKGIEMEYKLLDAQWKLLKADIARSGQSVEDALGPNFASDYETLLKDAQISATTAAIDEEDAKRLASITKVEEARRAAALATISATGATAEERIRTADTGTFDQKNKEGTDFEATVAERTQAMQALAQPMIDTLKSLGPEGEAFAIMAEGAFAMTETWSDTFTIMTSESASTAEKMGSAFGAVGQTIGALGSALGAASKAEIAGVDAAINAEKRRDGKSKESLNKLKALEGKKTSIQKKAFETDKKMKMGQTVMATAAGVMQAFAQLGPIAGPVMAAIVTALGAAQLAAISSSSFSGGASSVASSGPTSVNMGERVNKVDFARANSASGEQAFIRGESGIGTGATNFTPAFTGVKHRAVGGATTGFIVGEQGPELFMPDTPGVIKPADETANSLGPNVTAQFNISTVDATGVEDLLNAQRGNIIGMIRQAANQHGETFLETVQDDSLT